MFRFADRYSDPARTADVWGLSLHQWRRPVHERMHRCDCGHVRFGTFVEKFLQLAREPATGILFFSVGVCSEEVISRAVSVSASKRKPVCTLAGSR